jgi:hypothetical protein
MSLTVMRLINVVLLIITLLAMVYAVKWMFIPAYGLGWTSSQIDAAIRRRASAAPSSASQPVPSEE